MFVWLGMHCGVSMTERGMPVSFGPKEAQGATWSVTNRMATIAGARRGLRVTKPGPLEFLPLLTFPQGQTEFLPFSRAELVLISICPEVCSDPKTRGKEKERTFQAPDLGALERRLAVNGNVFDETAKDHFSGI